MPISPDEIAVHRYSPEDGSLSLIVRYGNWGCGTRVHDGRPGRLDAARVRHGHIAGGAVS
ncbi:hypothetical protein [Streptomyces sp. NPDC048737]|uniref:hypothetical protein n=1 Tax=unclassified Streptomyces TaxID=2593676 RepID=UPI003412A794